MSKPESFDLRCTEELRHTPRTAPLKGGALGPMTGRERLVPGGVSEDSRGTEYDLLSSFFSGY